MWNKRILASLLGLFSLTAHPHEFKEGQVWSYKTRPGEEGSRLYIVKVEAWPNGEKIFHVHADGLKIRNPMLAKGFQEVLPHAPVSKNTLDLSVVKLVTVTKKIPDISEGYSAWKEGYDAGKAGVFTISIAEIISLIEGVVSKNAK